MNNNIIQPSTSIERRLLFIETLINATDKVSKVSDNSVLSGVAEGVAKVSGKAEKDIALAISQLFPDTASQDQLDQVALNYGISPRFQAIGSSTYLRIAASPGTIYLANTHYFNSLDGVRFELEGNVLVGSLGFTYVRVKSVTTGSNTNVGPLTISKVSPQPTGHIDVVNEYMATGGRDTESDEIFRVRLKDGPNILAKGTISMIEQLFININNKVLKVFHQGSDRNGKINLSIVTQNGSNLTQTELDDLLKKSATSFSLTEYKPFGTNFYGIKLSNIEYQPIDISFRANIDNSYNIDTIRIAIQSNISKYLDPRFFDSSTQKVEWDNLLEICKNTPGIIYVPDQYFYPRVDLSIDPFKLPRVRSFLLLNIDGQVMSDYTGTLSPIYYPNIVDESYHQTVLNNIS